MNETDGAHLANELLPLSRVDFLVLLVLTDGERHAYGIVKEIAERTSGKVQPLPGNLYAVMRRLMEHGLVERAKRGAVLELKHRERRYYRITDVGIELLAADAAMMESLVRQAAARDLIQLEAQE